MQRKLRHLAALPLLFLACTDPDLLEQELIGTWLLVESEPLRLPVVADTTTMTGRDGRPLYEVMLIDSLRIEIGPAASFDPADSGLRYTVEGVTQHSIEPLGGPPRFNVDCCRHLLVGHVEIVGRGVRFEPCTFECGSVALVDGRVTDDVMTVTGSIRLAEIEGQRPVRMAFRKVSPCIDLAAGPPGHCFPVAGGASRRVDELSPS